jgi:hypothetical protein
LALQLLTVVQRPSSSSLSNETWANAEGADAIAAKATTPMARGCNGFCMISLLFERYETRQAKWGRTRCFKALLLLCGAEIVLPRLERKRPQV